MEQSQSQSLVGQERDHPGLAVEVRLEGHVARQVWGDRPPAAAFEASSREHSVQVIERSVAPLTALVGRLVPGDLELDVPGRAAVGSLQLEDELDAGAQSQLPRLVLRARRVPEGEEPQGVALGEHDDLLLRVSPAGERGLPALVGEDPADRTGDRRPGQRMTLGVEHPDLEATRALERDRAHVVRVAQPFEGQIAGDPPRALRDRLDAPQVQRAELCPCRHPQLR